MIRVNERLGKGGGGLDVERASNEDEVEEGRRLKAGRGKGVKCWVGVGWERRSRLIKKIYI